MKNKSGILKEKRKFLKDLKRFVKDLQNDISCDGKWTVKGFIDVLQNIYTISADTKVISKILEIHLFPFFLEFAQKIGYRIELATYQNWYPDLTFTKLDNEGIKFAVDLKTTYRDEKRPGYCNGFTLGSHGEYFIDRKSKKNIQYPYGEYLGHFCVGIIYTRVGSVSIDETRKYSLEEINSIPSVAQDFLFFAEEKWKIASDKSGSGNTANIGSIKCINDIICGRGVFVNEGEKIFDDYWANYGVAKVKNAKGEYVKLTSLQQFLEYKGLKRKENKKRRKNCEN